jgi:hypothetical protein
MWKYRCYDDGRQPNLWQRWYEAHSDYQGSHTAVFDFLEQCVQWKMPWADTLGDGLIEVRLSGKVKWRVLGYYSDVRVEFVVVLVCNHKQNVYAPKDAIPTAKKRMRDIKAGKQRTIICVRPK